jgi:site-specific recombinase XerD
LIDVMPRPRWPHLLREVSRHGTVRWVVRIGHGPRVPIGHKYGTPEFSAAYQSAIRGEVVPPLITRVDARSLRFLVERWQASSAWSETGPATRQKRSALLKHALETSGHKPYKAVTRAHIIAGREKRAKTPAQANNFLAVMRALFKWAVKNDFVESDPTAGVEDLRRPNAARGIRIWTDDEIALFRARWPLGTRERLAFEILATTGLRRGDAARLGRQHIGEVDGISVLRLRTEKTEQAVVREIMPELKAAIDACPASGLALVARVNGAPLSKQSFGDWFRDACRAANVNKSPHGLRKHDAITLLHSGATAEEINASQGRMPHSPAIGAYTRERDDELLAARATAKLKAARKAKS